MFVVRGGGNSVDYLVVHNRSVGRRKGSTTILRSWEDVGTVRVVVVVVVMNIPATKTFFNGR